MKTIKLFFMLLLFGGNMLAQDASNVKVVKLTDKLYKIELVGGFEVNMLAFLGEDGLLLVDAGFKSTAKKLKEELRKLGNDKPAFIISTHEHIDHIGGNYIFGKEPVIIGHKNLKLRMKGSDYIYEEYPEHSLPELTFVDSLTLHFNGEDIRIISIAGSHSDNDIMVHFTKSGYAYLGDVAYGLHIPSVDPTSGNDSQYGSVVKKALDLLPDDTKFVSGHGRDLSMAEMREWQKMLEETISVIRKEMDNGKDIATMHAASQKKTIVDYLEEAALIREDTEEDWEESRS